MKTIANLAGIALFLAIFLSLIFYFFFDKKVEKEANIIEKNKGNIEKVSKYINASIPKTKKIIHDKMLELAKSATKKLENKKNELQDILAEGFKTKPFQISSSLKRRLTNEASAGILIDLTNKTILWGKNRYKPFPIASMTKIMTILLCIEQIEKNKISFNDKIKISVNASKIGGHQIYLSPKETMPLEDLFKATLIFSANDAAYMIAEYISGSEDKFVQKMNIRASQLQLSNTRFYNSNGLPEKKNNISSPFEIALLAANLIQHKQILKYSKTYVDFIRKDTKPFQLTNTNKLLKNCLGVNGLKTGYIKASGFCMTITAQRDKRILIGVLMGVKTSKKRNSLMKKLVNWGYSTVYL